MMYIFICLPNYSKKKIFISIYIYTSIYYIGNGHNNINH